MLTTDERPADLTSNLHVRVPGDLLPRLHAVARARGLCAASFARSVVMEAVAAAEHRHAA